MQVLEETINITKLPPWIHAFRLSKVDACRASPCETNHGADALHLEVIEDDSNIICDVWVKDQSIGMRDRRWDWDCVVVTGRI